MAIRDLTDLSATRPLRSAMATSASNILRRCGGFPSKCASSGTFTQECQILAVTKLWPHLGHVQSPRACAVASLARLRFPAGLVESKVERALGEASGQP